MQTIRILYSQYSLPSESSFYNLNFDNFQNAVKDKVNIELLCLVYRSKKLTNEEKKSKNKKILDYYDYNNAVELIKKEKPDLIIGSTFSTAIIDNSLSLAGNFLKIPVINWIQTSLLDNTISINTVNTLSRFFHNQNPTNNEKQFMMRGRFFLKRCRFFFKTQRATNMNMFNILSLFINYFKKLFFSNYATFNPKFSGVLSFLSGEKLFKTLVDQGFQKEKLVVTGFPAYDQAFQTLKNFIDAKPTNKIRVLFTPAAFYEHGFWTRKQRDKLLHDIILNLNNHLDEISLTVKIHPSYANLIEYEEIIHRINSSIIVHKNEDFFHLLEQSDVVIDFSSASTSLVFGVIAKKPIILCNYNHFQDDLLLKENLALKCDDPSQLFTLIHTALKSNPATKEKREKFIQDYLYKSDGKSSERILDKIITLLK